MNEFINIEEQGKYFSISNDRTTAAVIVNIQFTADAFLAIPNFPHMKWLAAQGKSPNEAFAMWHQKHIEHIKKIGRVN